MFRTHFQQKTWKMCEKTPPGDPPDTPRTPLTLQNAFCCWGGMCSKWLMPKNAISLFHGSSDSDKQVFEKKIMINDLGIFSSSKSNFWIGIHGIWHVAVTQQILGRYFLGFLGGQKCPIKPFPPLDIRGIYYSFFSKTRSEFCLLLNKTYEVAFIQRHTVDILYVLFRFFGGFKSAPFNFYPPWISVVEVVFCFFSWQKAPKMPPHPPDSPKRIFWVEGDVY